MNLIPESNGIQKVNMRQKADTKQWIKTITFIILGIFATGFLIQVVGDFIGKEKISLSLNYAKVDDKKMEYKLTGSGDYTVVFDGNIGANLYQWDSVIEALNQKGLEVKTFIYNRRGYGFSDGGSIETPEKQAENLKILLRKAGAGGKLILVGEEYGSLVMTNFAELYPDSVAGMVLINPYSSEVLNSSEFKDNIKWTYLKSKVEKVGTNFSLTRIMDKINIDYHNKEFENSLSGDTLEEFNILKDQSSYRKAVNNELETLYTYSSQNPEKGLVKGKPLYIITNDEDDTSKELGSEDLTTMYLTESDSKILSVSDPASIATGISNVVKSAKKIAKKSAN